MLLITCFSPAYYSAILIYTLNTIYLYLLFDLTPVWISLKTAIVSTIITFLIGVFVANWMWNYKGKFKSLLEVILTAPLVLPPTVIGFILLLLLGKNSLLGKVLDAANIRIVFSWYATVIAATIVSFPLMYKTALGAFKQIDANLIACGRTLGASEWTIFWRLLLPLAKPGLIAGVLLSFARSLGEFGATLMLAGSIPGQTETIPIAIFLAAESGDIDRAFFLVIVILTISLTVITAVNKWEKKKLFQTDKKRYFKKEKGCSNKNKFPENNSSANLIVDIEKKRSQFYVKVNFIADSYPLAILGASGAGKTTVVRCIAGLETPDRGFIMLNGRVLYDSVNQINLPVKERNCGLLFQDYALFPHLTVRENIAFGISNKLSNKEVQTIVEKQLIAVALIDKGDRFPQELSGGEKQRVALARVKANNPEIMLLDEPFSALDTYLRHQQEKLLRQSLQTYKGVTLLITHNLEEAYRICSNLLVIDRGKAIAFGNKEEIFKHSPNVKTAQVTNCKNFSQGVVLNKNQVKSKDWNCILEIENIPQEIINSLRSNITIGIRAHQIILTKDSNAVNTFSCWLASYSETQHRVTCYLKLHSLPHHKEDYHLQVEVIKDKWLELQKQSFPWNVELKPDRIMIFQD